MIEQLQSQPTDEDESAEAESQLEGSVHTMKLFAAAVGKEPETPVLQLEIEL